MSTTNINNNNATTTTGRKLSIGGTGGVETNGLFSKFLITQFDTETNKPVISYKWTPKGTQESKDEADDNKIQQFCYPESVPVIQNIMATITTDQVNYFSFILTNSYGVKSYAYCKRILRKQPVCFVFISIKPHFSLFDQIFTVIETKFDKKVNQIITNLLNSVATYPIDFQQAQTEIKASSNSSQSETYEFLYTRPTSDFEHISYEPIFNMKPQHIVKLYESLLCEARIILCSSSISKISNSILALSSLIYPFVWQHIFISILPEPLMPYVAAPIPFLVGILESSLKSFYQQPTEQVLLYNLDKCEFMIDPNFKSLLPVHISNYLENSVKSIKMEKSFYDSSFDRVIRRPFLSVIYHLFEHYNMYMIKSGGSFNFIKDEFLQSFSGPLKKLIDTLVCSQMVEMFFNQKEEEFTKQDNAQCLFLEYTKDYVDKIPTISSKRQSQLDCPICMESTTGSQHSIEFSGYLMHQQCFRCKTCSNNLMGQEREKIILKRKDGERIQIYCADCRSKTFLNKLKNTSSQSKMKMYKFFSDMSAFANSGGDSSISTYQQPTSTSSTSTKIQISSPQPIYSNNNTQSTYPVVPVKNEIHNFKFKKLPPKDLGGKSLSMGKFPGSGHASTLPGPLNLSQLRAQQQQHPLHRGANGNAKNTLQHSNQAGSLVTPHKSKSAILPGERAKPPLPPTPGEKKERAVEQMNKKLNINLHVHTDDLEDNSHNQHQIQKQQLQQEQEFEREFKNSMASLFIGGPTVETKAMQFAKALPLPPPTSPIPSPPSSTKDSSLSPQNNDQQKQNRNNNQNNNQRKQYLPPIPSITTSSNGRPLPTLPINTNNNTSSSSASSSASTSPSSSNLSSPRGILKTSGGSSPSKELTIAVIAASLPSSLAPLPSEPPLPTYTPIRKPLPKPNISNSVNDVPIFKPQPTPTKMSQSTDGVNLKPPQVKPPPQLPPKTRKEQLTHTNHSTKLSPPVPKRSPSNTSYDSNNNNNSSRPPISSPDSSLSPRRLNQYCQKCKKQLTPTSSIVYCNQNYYHQQCFVCEKCLIPLQKGEQINSGGYIYHQDCLNDDESHTTTNNYLPPNETLV